MNSNWQTSAPFEHLQQRAAVLATIRTFFQQRNVLEVETPLLSHAGATDLHLHSFKTEYRPEGGGKTETLYLQTSPEYAMKRLLASGSGAIFQVCKAFRNGEVGRQHNPEFTMLEWYRPGFDHHQLMDEMDQLLRQVLSCQSAERLSYAEAFQQHCQLDPHRASLVELQQFAKQHALLLHDDDRDTWLQLIMSHCIEPQLGQQQPCFIYDYPQSQAALAKIRKGDPPVAERFEVYIQGVELANGFHELTDSKEQRQRFQQDLMKRQTNNLPAVPIDEHLLAALEHGLPACAGVALGIDRLVMLACKTQSIAAVNTFTFDQILPPC